MDKLAALKALGFDEQASPSPEAATAAHASKKAEVEPRIATAPTEALKTKYQSAVNELDEALAILTGKKEARSSSIPGISKSALYDLPGAMPFYTQAGDVSAGAAQGLSFTTGDVIMDRYEIRKSIGAGGMGVVYAAFDRNADQEIALKVLLPALMNNERARERFFAEAKISRQLSHAGVVNVYDINKSGDLYFISMELLEGKTLRQEMAERRAAQKNFSVEEILRIGLALCDALAYAHEFTIHRDVKPENIFVTTQGKIKLMDFGLARLQSSSQLTRTGMAMGTAYYMAPEQLEGSKDIDARADQYALAVVLYELFTGSIPVGRVKSVHSRRPEVSEQISHALDKGLSGDANERFPDIAAFAAELGGNLGRQMSSPPKSAPIKTEPIPASPPPISPAPPPRSPQSSSVPGKELSPAPIAAVLGVLLAGGIGSYFYFNGQSANNTPIPTPRSEASAAPSSAVQPTKVQPTTTAVAAKVNVNPTIPPAEPTPIDEEAKRLRSQEYESTSRVRADAQRLTGEWNELQINGVVGANAQADAANTALNDGDALFRSQEFRSAKVNYEKSITLYQQALEGAKEIRAQREVAIVAQSTAAKAADEWSNYGARSGVKDPPAIDEARREFQRGEKMFGNRNFKGAADSFTIAAKQYAAGMVQVSNLPVSTAVVPTLVPATPEPTAIVAPTPIPTKKVELDQRLAESELSERERLEQEEKQQRKISIETRRQVEDIALPVATVIPTVTTPRQQPRRFEWPGTTTTTNEPETRQERQKLAAISRAEALKASFALTRSAGAGVREIPKAIEARRKMKEGDDAVKMELFSDAVTSFKAARALFESAALDLPKLTINGEPVPGGSLRMKRGETLEIPKPTRRPQTLPRVVPQPQPTREVFRNPPPTPSGRRRGLAID